MEFLKWLFKSEPDFKDIQPQCKSNKSPLTIELDNLASNFHLSQRQMAQRMWDEQKEDFVSRMKLKLQEAANKGDRSCDINIPTYNGYTQDYHTVVRELGLKYTVYLQYEYFKVSW